jgi:hypothetical protein
VTHTAAAPERTTLTREMSEFLVAFTVALQQYAMYPSGHPLLNHAVDNVTRKLAAILSSRTFLVIGVARDQLVIDGVTTDPTNAQLRELAMRLHRHQLGALKILGGVRRDEMSDFLTAAAVDPQIAEKQLAPLVDQLHRWPHVRVYSLTFDRLALMEDEAEQGTVELGSRAAKLWVALARAALLTDLSEEEAASVEPEAVSRSLDAGGHPDRDRSVAGHLAQIAGELKLAGGPDGQSLRRKVSTLVRSMRPETLMRLLSMGGDAEARKKFVLDASHELAVEAVLSLVQAAARESRQTISHAMLRLLGKLALQAEEGGPLVRAGADMAFRERVQQMVESWDIDRLNPDNYRQALERMSRLKLFAHMAEREHPCEPRRTVMTAIETDTLGAPVWRALQEMITGKEISVLLDVLDRAPESSAVAAELWARVATRENLRQLLRDEQFEVTLLDRIVDRMGLEIVDVLLDALETADARATRRKLLDMLTRFGSEIGPIVAARLAADRPWFVQRNLLTLLGQMPELPPGFSPTFCLSHTDARVRREALKLMLRMPTLRDEAVTTAVGDDDERMVLAALSAALESCPATAVPVIMRRVDDRRIPGSARPLAIRAVATSRSPAALEWLLQFVEAKKRWYSFRRKLAHKSPDMLAAISGLASSYLSDERAAVLVELARKSSDAEVRSATSPRRASTPRGVPAFNALKEEA